MDKLKAILESNGVTKTDEELREYVEGRGMNPDSLNDADVVNLANALISSSGKMTQSKGGKPSTKTTSKRSPRTPNSLDTAIKKVAHQTRQELDELANAIEQGADQYSQVQAKRMLDTLSDVPNKTVEYFADLAGEYEGDPEGFRQIGEQISAGIFGTFTANPS